MVCRCSCLLCRVQGIYRACAQGMLLCVLGQALVNFTGVHQFHANQKQPVGQGQFRC